MRFDGPPEQAAACECRAASSSCVSNRCTIGKPSARRQPLGAAGQLAAARGRSASRRAISASFAAIRSPSLWSSPSSRTVHSSHGRLGMVERFSASARIKPPLRFRAHSASRASCPCLARSLRQRRQTVRSLRSPSSRRAVWRCQRLSDLQQLDQLRRRFLAEIERLAGFASWQPADRSGRCRGRYAVVVAADGRSWRRRSRRRRARRPGRLDVDGPKPGVAAVDDRPEVLGLQRGAVRA